MNTYVLGALGFVVVVMWVLHWLRESPKKRTLEQAGWEFLIYDMFGGGYQSASNTKLGLYIYRSSQRDERVYLLKRGGQTIRELEGDDALEAAWNYHNHQTQTSHRGGVASS